MTHPYTRHIALEGTYNIRDLGGYPAGHGGMTRWRRILRSDSLHRLSREAVESLVAEGVSTVIDLRAAQEVAAAPNPFSDHSTVAYLNKSLFDGLIPANMDPEGPAAVDDVLHALYVDALTQRQEAIRFVLAAIANPGSDGAVLFHCTAGKDRTGLIAALVLGAVDVDHEHIVSDYALTEAMIAPLAAELTANAVARGAEPEAFRKLLGSAPQTMRATLRHIEKGYGSIRAYLEAIGCDAGLAEALRARLVSVPPSQAGVS